MSGKRLFVLAVILSGLLFAFQDELILTYFTTFNGTFADDVFECDWTPRDRRVLLPALRDHNPRRRNVAAYVYHHLVSREGISLAPAEVAALRISLTDPSPEARHYAGVALDSIGPRLAGSPDPASASSKP